MSKFNTIKGLAVNQLTSKPMVIASMKFKVLRNIIKFTVREPQEYDPFNPEKNISKITEDVNKSYYQRLINDSRIDSICNFLLREINKQNNPALNSIGTFPTSIILSLSINQDFERVEDYMDYTEKQNENEDSGAYYNKIDDKNVELLIPDKKVALVVDGQHRLAAMIRLYEDANNDNIRIGKKSFKTYYPELSNEMIIKSLNEFELNCVILLGFDIWEQGRVFADVNFNQKPVNKSLYYDIFGSFPEPNKNDIFLAHMLALHLNSNPDSVIKGFIKMLGAGKGYFSQAFFVEALLQHFNKTGIWASLPLNFLEGGTEHKILPKFFQSYFKAIKTVFSDYWPKIDEDTSSKYKHVLAKTTGMGALLKLVGPIYKKLKVEYDIKSIDEEQLTLILIHELGKAKNRGVEFFSKSGL